MTDPGGPVGPDPVHYPDVAMAGDLRTALQAAFDAAGVPLRALHVPSPGWLRVGAEVRAGDRHANVGMALNERLFLLSGWMRGICMARGTTTDLGDIAAAISTFLSGVGVRQLVTAWPFVSTGGFAEAFERGEPAAIAYRWRQYLELPPARARHMVELHEFLTAAACQPRLRALFPFTSHQDLGVRRSVSDGAGRALAWVRSFGAGGISSRARTAASCTRPVRSVGRCGAMNPPRGPRDQPARRTASRWSSPCWTASCSHGGTHLAAGPVGTRTTAVPHEPPCVARGRGMTRCSAWLLRRTVTWCSRSTTAAWSLSRNAPIPG